MEKDLLGQVNSQVKKLGLPSPALKGATHLYVESNKVLSLMKEEGVILKTKQLRRGVRINLKIKEGFKIKKPIFLCFSLLSPNGFQEIIVPEVILEKNSEAQIFSLCMFPQAEKVVHKMETKIILKEGARLTYNIKHYHGENFGVNLLSETEAFLGKGACFDNDFILDRGTVGKLKLILRANLEENAFAKVSSKVVERGKYDKTEIDESVNLEGAGSQGILKTKGIAQGGGKVFFKGMLRAGRKAKNARGHMDCEEIIVGNSFARSIPAIEVLNPEARITHEASVGKVNQKELETLMTRGLSEEKAIDFIIRGKLKS